MITAAEAAALYVPPKNFTLAEIEAGIKMKASAGNSTWAKAGTISKEDKATLEENGFSVTLYCGTDKNLVHVSWAKPAQIDKP